MKKNLKIAIYSGVIPGTTFIERLITGIANSGNKVILFGILKDKPSYDSNVTVVGFRYTRWSKSCQLLRYSILLILFKSKEKKRLDAYLKRRQDKRLNSKVKFYSVLWHKPDIFHIQWVAGLDDWMWVKDFGIRLIVSLRGAHINYSPIVNKALAQKYRQNFPKVDGFHAVSHAIADEAGQYGVQKEDISVIKSGLNLHALTFKPKVFDSSKPLKILSVGRDHWKKNYRLALDALQVLKLQDVAFKYVIIGVTDNEALLFQRAQLGLDNEVKFMDAMPFNEVKKAIRQADVMLLPSLEEGIANVVLEAMALGTLVVSTNCGGMPEVVIPGKTGYLMPLQNVQAMATALKDVSQLTAEAYLKLIKQAREFIELNHSEQGMINAMNTLYDNVARLKT